MMKSLKSMAIVLVGLVFFALGQPILAQEIESKGIITPQTYSYLALTKCYFIDSEDGLISVSGKTTTYSTVDKITTTVYLQKQTSTEWVNVKSWTNSGSNTSSCNVSGTITVEKGCYYRTYCYHRADKGNLTETNTSQTTAYWVE
ncbi:hypothetical protein Dtox_0504 [Desulfofarcimen acetoxidans DSM 771]|uniref:Ig-like domain-containing protein n=1 Tax=Desulfofarcimen acetoxidans (strain ATCC 49208 / DSM 771 / KCTC 5769 / VKM B-1644 / 5575) TaxID=485916 RepID=C8W5X2_DESAS|nr:DUF6147 family protein [Desulfofarcimen acetoxidans]ACV61427.1 hypothetical protein Dtox_0504 [Desulfofarcimen acetoxidans DSM 771]